MRPRLGVTRSNPFEAQGPSVPYFVKSSMADQPPELTIDERSLPGPDPAWADLRENTTELKIWVTPGVLAAADALARQYEHSVTIIVRNALVIHVYGRYAFDRMVLAGALRAPRGYSQGPVVNPKLLKFAQRSGTADPHYFDPASDPPAAHALDLRKPVYGLRVFMPTVLRLELEALAVEAGLPVSQYCREVLTAYYLGTRATQRA